MDIRKIMGVFAYYLSEYDNNAFSALGFDTQTAGFTKIAGLYGKKPSYLRRLRDEYDVVTSNQRNGQRNRPPRESVVQTKDYLSSYSFTELTEMVSALIENAELNMTQSGTAFDDSNLPILSEAEIENIINFVDERATIDVRTRNNNIRVYNKSIIKQLKRLYKGYCQLCGTQIFADFTADLCEAHHIDAYSSSLNNNASNIIILCPNHHRLIHKENPFFNRDKGCFEFRDGKKIEILIDHHLLP